MNDLLLLIVSYHTTSSEVLALSACLDSLPAHISYSVIVNHWSKSDPINQLEQKSQSFVRVEENLGYGRAVNRLFSSLDTLPTYIGILNTDLTWADGTFEDIINYFELNENVSLMVPRILNRLDEVQYLCKRNPTLLALLSRRFIPAYIKPSWLKYYDQWYVMADKDYDSIFESSYLSGCCMIIRTTSFIAIGGFDERYFLYLEDADITRSISRVGRCLHYPRASVVHAWGRGNYKSMRLQFVNLISSFKYFFKWGLELW